MKLKFRTSCFIILSIIIFKPFAAQDWDQNIRSLLLNDHFEEALLVSDTVHVADTMMDELHYYRGKAFQQLFQFDSALQYYSLASMADTLSMVKQIAVGQMLAKLGRSMEAIEVYENARERFTLGNHHLVELASLYTIRNQHQKSLNIYLDLHESDRKNYFYIKQAGKCYQELHRTDSTLACFKTASELNPADVYLAFQIANIYLKRKDFVNAISHLQKGFAYDSNNLDLLKLRGYVLMHSHGYEDAILDFEKARILDPNSVFIQKYLGMCYYEESQYGYAREALLLAYQLDSTDAETAFFLGNACRWGYYEEEGIKYYLKSIELQLPDKEQIISIYSQLAEVYKVLHRFNDALNAYLMILEYDPDDNTVYFKIGQMYDRNLNEKKLAIEYYEKYLNSGPTDQQLFDASKGTSKALRRHTEQRIDKLKEDLFFEN